MGRSKIPITWIKSDASRQVTFNKRKKGMKKKAEELAILCGVDVCMICYGPTISGGKNQSVQQAQITSSSSTTNNNQPQSSAGSSSSSSQSANNTSNNSMAVVPFSWGMPGVSSVISKFEGLPKEERDKKKLDNTSLLEQQIKKLRRELAWDDRLDCYTIEDLKRLADCLLEKLRITFERISCWEHQTQQQHQHPADLIPQASELDTVATETAIFAASTSSKMHTNNPGFVPFINPFVLPSQQQHGMSISLNPLPPIPPVSQEVRDQQHHLNFVAAPHVQGFLEENPHYCLPVGIGPSSSSHIIPNSCNPVWNTAPSSEAVVTSTFPCSTKSLHAAVVGDWEQPHEETGAPLLHSMLFSAINATEATSDESKAEHSEFRAHLEEAGENDYS